MEIDTIKRKKDQKKDQKKKDQKKFSRERGATIVDSRIFSEKWKTFSMIFCLRVEIRYCLLKLNQP